MTTATALPRRGIVLADVIPGERVRDGVLIVSGALISRLISVLSFAVMSFGMPAGPNAPNHTTAS